MKAQRLAFCRECGTETAQMYLCREPFDVGHPFDVEHSATMWRCRGCTNVFLTYADVSDAQGFALLQAAKWLRGDGAGAAGDETGLDRAEVEAVAMMELLTAFRKWRPERGVRFRAYATGRVRLRLTDWLRRERGRAKSQHTGRPIPAKAHVGAVPLDASWDDDERGVALADRLEPSQRRGGSDDPADRVPVVVGVFARRDRDLLRAERKLGFSAAR